MPWPALLRRRDDVGEGDSISVNPAALFDLPPELSAFVDEVGTGGTFSCDKGGGIVLDTRDGGYKENGAGKDGTHYCGNKAEQPTYVWWVSNMDIDCDGSEGTTGPCASDQSFLGDTAFQDDQGSNIDAQSVQYVVINQGDAFEPTQHNIEPLSVVAVVCNGKLTYGVWADTNALGSMGEASVYLGRVCYGSQINGNYGHSEADVLYIAFPGGKDKTVPDQQGKDAKAMFLLGKKLVEAAFGGDGGEEEEGTAKGGDGTVSASSVTYTAPTGSLGAGAAP
ncbi:hypothetical protein Rhopal_007392-T1 [Rhodotorula paludigena]|uniref:Endo-chitosanase n=1 Tax=Rhodotorula paludigena TaxID=86838 RepID=A0AAV5GVK7_9BASI|nr:hypothetical protein Rhopal_007392-T1 [Rhodotorula paludigena]